MTWTTVDIETKSTRPDDPDLAVDYLRNEITSLAWWTDDRRDRGVVNTLDGMARFLADSGHRKWVTHGGKFDAKTIGRVFGVQLVLSWDTLLAESILPDRPVDLDLETCVAKELGFPKWKDKRLYTQMAAGVADQTSVSTLALQDVEYTYMLFQTQWKKLEELGLLDYFLNNQLAMRSLNFLRSVEERGFQLDYPKMQEAWTKNLAKRSATVARLYEGYRELVQEYEQAQLAKHPLVVPSERATPATWAKYKERLHAREEKYRFDFTAPKQVLWLLKDKLGFPCKSLEGKDSTSKDVLEFYRGQHPIIDDLLELRHNEHDASSFYSSWDYYLQADGRLHPTYRMDVARTFRLTCTEPNLQQVPRGSEFRSFFVAKPGHKLMVVDYSQIEPRLIAHYSNDETLLSIYRYGMDIYEVVGRRVLGFTGTSEEFKANKPLRNLCKEIALSSFYGIGPDKFAYRIRLKTGLSVTPGQARDYIRGYFDLLPGVVAYKQRLPRELEDQRCGPGEYPTIRTPLGRTIGFKPHEFYHLAFNKLIQCTGSDINLASQVDLDDLFRTTGMRSRCIHLVHDEAIFEYPPEEEDRLLQAVNWIMADRYAGEPWNLRVPIKVEIKTGLDWSCK